MISNHSEVESRSLGKHRPSPNLDMFLEEINEQVVDHLMETLQAVEKELLPYQLKLMVIKQGYYLKCP